MHHTKIIMKKNHSLSFFSVINQIFLEHFLFQIEVVRTLFNDRRSQFNKTQDWPESVMNITAR